MIVVDANLLVYAYNKRMPQHVPARHWLEETFSSGVEVGIPMQAILAFIRLSTNTKLNGPHSSLPAVLSITRNPFLAYTSNIMAVMGLRSLYFLIIASLTRLRFLHYGLAAVLAFAAVKMLAVRWIEISPLVSLAVILALLGITIVASLLAPGKSAS